MRARPTPPVCTRACRARDSTRTGRRARGGVRRHVRLRPPMPSRSGRVRRRSTLASAGTAPRVMPAQRACSSQSSTPTMWTVARAAAISGWWLARRRRCEMFSAKRTLGARIRRSHRARSAARLVVPGHSGPGAGEPPRCRQWEDTAFCGNARSLATKISDRPPRAGPGRAVRGAPRLLVVDAAGRSSPCLPARDAAAPRGIRAQESCGGVDHEAHRVEQAAWAGGSSVRASPCRNRKDSHEPSAADGLPQRARESPTSAPRAVLLGRRSPGCTSPETIIDLIPLDRLVVTATPSRRRVGYRCHPALTHRRILRDCIGTKHRVELLAVRRERARARASSTTRVVGRACRRPVGAEQQTRAPKQSSRCAM